MATTNLKVLSGPYKDVEVVDPVALKGTGAPANNDEIATNVDRYPIGSTYIDTTNHKFYFREAVAGVAADWVITN